MNARQHLSGAAVVAALFAALLVMTHCGSEPPCPDEGCDPTTDAGGPECRAREYPIPVQSCDGGDCAEETVCARLCEADGGGCPAGRACELSAYQLNFCGLQCHSALCPGLQECSSPRGECLDVACGIKAPCAGAGQFCAMEDHECYPLSGACGSGANCPRLGERGRAVAEVDCVQGYCRVSPVPLAPIGDLFAEAEVTILTPSRGQSFSEGSALRIHWEGPQAAAIVLILRERPVSKEDLKTFAIWGAALPKGSRQEVSLEQGSAIQEGTWLSDPGELPVGAPLYVLVQLVEGTRLLAASKPVPFSLGAAWAWPGVDCQPEGLPAACANPSLPMACHEERCRVLCASHRDCSPWGESCGVPHDGLRFCE